MKVAHVLTTSIPLTHDKGGAVQRRVLAVAQEQAAMGCEVTIYAAGESGAFNIGPVTVCGIPCTSKRPYRDYEYLFRVRSMLRSRTFDIIHSHGVPDAVRVLGRTAKGAKFLLTVDFFRYKLTSSTLARRYYKNSLRMYGTICPVSKFCHRELLRFYGDDISAHIDVVYNGVDISQFYPDKVEAERIASAYQLPREAPYVLYLGRINRQKGSDMLPELARRLQDVKIVAAGPTGQFGRVGKDDVVDDLRRSGAKYLGAIPGADLRGLLSGATALVLPTRQDEMFGMVLIEAGACGTPAVASDLGGIPEAMGDGGLLCSAGDIGDLTEKTQLLVRNRAMRQRLSQAAFDNARQFAWSRIAEDYISAYQR